MAGLTLGFEPLDVDVDDPAERATWGRLTVTVCGRVVTLVHDRFTQSARDGVNGSVLPLAEWFVRHWASLFSGVWPPPPTSLRREFYEWQRSHAWRMAGQGMALPAVEMWRSDVESVSLRVLTDDVEIDHERVVFLQSLRSTALPLRSVKETVASFVDLVLRRCEERAPDAPRTQELRATWMQATDPDDHHRPAARLATRLGRAWGLLDDAERAVLADLCAAHSPSVLGVAEVLPWVDASEIDRAVRHIHGLLPTTEAVDPATIKLRSGLQRSEAPTAWARGWADASAFRHRTGRPDDLPIVPDDWAVWSTSANTEGVTSDPSDSVVGWLPGRQPLRLVGRSTRFREARDLWPTYFGGESDALTLVGLGARGSSRAVANAFATELLAPIAAVRREVGNAPEVHVERIDEIAEDLGAPATCVRHQIENHKLARVEP